MLAKDKIVCPGVAKLSRLAWSFHCVGPEASCTLSDACVVNWMCWLHRASEMPSGRSLQFSRMLMLNSMYWLGSGFSDDVQARASIYPLPFPKML